MRRAQILFRPLVAAHRRLPTTRFPLASTTITADAQRKIPFIKWLTHHSLQTLAPSPPTHPDVSDHWDAVHNASTVEETLAAFQSLEPSLVADEQAQPALGPLCLDVAKRLESFDPPDLENALDFAIRALKSYQGTHGRRSIEVAGILRLIGLIACRLGKFDDSLQSLEMAEEILGFVKQEIGIGGELSSLLVEVQVQIARTKTAMGRRREAVSNIRRSVELREEMMGLENEVLGAAYVELVEAYTAVLEFAEALPFCRKALHLHEEEFGQSSMEVVKIRRLLGVIYSGLEENEEALEQLELARRELTSLGEESVLIEVEIDAANIQIMLGRWNEAKNNIIRAVQRAKKGTEAHAYGLISMAKVMCGDEKFDDARRTLEIACEILESLLLESPLKVVEMYAEISMLYELMNDFEIALSLMQRSLEILKKLPEEQNLEGSMAARFGWLLLLTERHSEAIPYLKGAIEKLKCCFGSSHFGLGFAYKHLGQAYLATDQPQMAVKMFFLAKKIVDDSFGLYHEDSIDINQGLANAYGVLGSYDHAMKFQQLVLEAWENHGSKADWELKEAHRLLWQLKRKAEGSRSAVFPANSLPSTVQQ